MIKCSECEHENEGQRVYCHNCGARLDRSALIEEAQKPKKIVKPKKRLTDAEVNGVFKNFIKTTLFAALAACVVQAVRPPDGAPEARELGDSIVEAPFISVDLEEAAISPQNLRYSEAQLNAYLKNRLKPAKDPTIPTWVSTFGMAFVNLQQDSVCFTKQFLVFTQPFYVGGSYLPRIGSNGLELKTLGGNIGRLPIHAMLFDLVDDFIFGDFAKNMSEEAKSAGKLQSIQVTPKTISLTSILKKS